MGAPQRLNARSAPSPTVAAGILAVMAVMKVRRRPIWPWIGLLLLVAVVAGAFAYILHAQDPKSAGTLVQTLVGLAGTAGTAAGWLWARRRPAEAAPSQLERAADVLAEQVRQRWQRAATERHLMYPAPILLRWRWSRRQVTGPITEAVGGNGGSRFGPLVGMKAMTAERLQSGTLEDFLDVYGGLDSGRLIILGGPGTGKTSAAIRLLLDALRHRKFLETAEERARFPVPLLFTLHGWDPDRTKIVDWLADRLEHDYEFLTAREYGPDAAAQLINGNYLMVILDGLDEMPEGSRPVILSELDEQATFRLVLLTRSDELVSAVSAAHLTGAAALELCPVEPGQAAEYLARCQIDSASPAWQRVVDHLSDHPHSILAQALDTPLMVTLIRDTYRHGGPVDELIDSSRFASRETIEDHLLDRVLPVAYARHRGRPAPPYTVDEARQWLGLLARHMNEEGTRDLAWWQIPRWVPAWPRVLATALVVGLVDGFMGVLGEGLVIGFSQGFREGFERALVFGLVSGLTYALVFGLISALVGRYPRQLGWLPRGRAAIRTALVFGIVVGLGFGLANGFVWGRLYGSGPGFLIGLTNGLFNMVVVGLAFGLLSRFAGPSVDAMSPINARSLWCQERRRGLKAGFVFGLVNGLMTTLEADIVVITFILKRGLMASFRTGLLTLFGDWLMFGFGVVLVSSTTWAATLASVQLWRRGETPLRLLSFLEDAHGREVLRSVGPLYQFRHARLQDRLAGTHEEDSTGRPPATLASGHASK
jgi:hypothetical protein